MPNAHLKSLTLGPFQSFKKPVTIEFPDTGLVLLQGRNKNTGGGSGAGKSSIIRALNFVQGICDTASTELQTWGLKDPATAGARWTYDGGELVVGRGKRYEVKVNGEAFAGSAGQKEEHVLKLLGGKSITKETLQILTYRGQRKPGLFLSKTDAEKKDFLTQLLDLEKFERAIETATANVNNLILAVEKARYLKGVYDESMAALVNGSDLDAMTAGMTLLQSELAALDATVRECTGAVAEMKVQYDAIRANGVVLAREAEAAFTQELAAANAALVKLSNVEIVAQENPEIAKYEKLVSECQGRINRLLVADREKQEAVSKELGQLQLLMNTARMAVTLAKQAKTTKDQLDRELAQYTASICPTCEREWADAHLKKDALLTKIQKAVHAIDAGAKAERTVEQLTAEMTPLRAPFVANPLIAKLQEAQSDAKARLAAEREKVESELTVRDAQHQTEVAKAQSALADVKARAMAAVSEVTAAVRVQLDEVQTTMDWTRQNIQQCEAKRTELTNTGVRLSAKIEQAKTLQGQISSATAALADAEAKLAAEKDFIGLIGREGFLGSIFDEVLAEISDETNQILATVANTRHCTLRFRSESLTQKGSVKKAIVPVVTVHGNETSLSAGLSGGMLSAVELAVDLAVGAVISRRSGCCPGWLILDESFDGLGPVEKESCLEILQLYAQNRLVIVVDHSSETQGLFTQKVIIDYEGDESTIAAA